MREMEEMEPIATSSNNLKGTYVRRLRQASSKVPAIGAELQQRTVVTVGYPVNSDGKSKMEEDLAWLRNRVRDLENEVSRILETVGRWFDTAVEKKVEKDEKGITVGAERGVRGITPSVPTGIMGPQPPQPSHPQPGPSRPRGSGGAGGAREGDGGTGSRVSL
jgi:hypothetical protein